MRLKEKIARYLPSTTASVTKLGESKPCWPPDAPGCYLSIPIFFLHFQLDDREMNSQFLLFSPEYAQSSGSLRGLSVIKNNRSRCWGFSLGWLGSTSRVPFAAANISACLGVCLSSSPLLLSSVQRHCRGGRLDMQPMILRWLFSICCESNSAWKDLRKVMTRLQQPSYFVLFLLWISQAKLKAVACLSNQQIKCRCHFHLLPC